MYDALITLYSASVGAPPTVERVYFDMVPISDGFYDAGLEDAAEGGDSAQGNANHAYYLKLPSNYETTSSKVQDENRIICITNLFPAPPVVF